jgi:hypothetical protein
VSSGVKPLGCPGWSKVASLATAFAAVAALYFTAQSLRATQNQYALSEQSQLSERFNRSIEQLGSDKADVRLGGIYSLEQLFRDSPSHTAVVFEVLGAYVRTHAGRYPAVCPQSAPTEDIGAVLTVIHRRLPVGPDPMTKSFEDAEQKGQTALINWKTVEDQTINLAGSLSGVNLAESQLPFADL